MKFENSVYSKIWDSSEGRQIVTSILNDPNLIKANHTFWREKFLVDPMITPTNAEGDEDFEGARYSYTPALGGIMYIYKMSPIPACVLKLNQARVNGWFQIQSV